MLVYFFDPHNEEECGCSEPLPISLQCLANQWAGKTGNPRELAELISEIEPDATISVSPPKLCELMNTWHFGMICVGLGREVEIIQDLTLREFNWRLLKFREIK